MKILIQIIFLLMASINLSAQEKDFSSFIPKGYDTLFDGVAKGDLNKDGIDDVVLALYSKMEERDDWMNLDANNKLPNRQLIILLGTKEGFKHSVKSTTALMCKNCGGVFGDPFSGINITKGVLSIMHYGGSAWRWGSTYKFRFQNNGWFLIGKTSHSYWNVKECEKLEDFAGTDYEDINLVTGQYESKKISEECELTENKKGKKKVLPLISLAKFKIDN